MPISTVLTVLWVLIRSVELIKRQENMRLKLKNKRDKTTMSINMCMCVFIQVNGQRQHDCSKQKAEEILHKTGQQVEISLLRKGSPYETQTVPTMSTISQRPLTPLGLHPPPLPPCLPEPKPVLPLGKVFYTERRDLNFNRECC